LSANRVNLGGTAGEYLSSLFDFSGMGGFIFGLIIINNIIDIKKHNEYLRRRTTYARQKLFDDSGAYTRSAKGCGGHVHTDVWSPNPGFPKFAPGNCGQITKGLPDQE
jgi:hypothetical protein